jgi:hypothetical protein
MTAWGIAYGETQLRVSRVDFAVDVLAPWFEPDRDCLVAPPGTRITEHTALAETVTRANGTRVTGLTAGAIGNRQIAIYDKRAEVLAKNNMAWPEIWNASLKAQGKPPLDLKDKDASQVWRFELRMGSKQLRNKFEMRDWQDLRDLIGDAFTDFLGRVRYTTQTKDPNRSRWPTHELWEAVQGVIGGDLLQYRSGVLPSDAKAANTAAKQRELNTLTLGLLVSSAALTGVDADEFEGFLEAHIWALQRLSEEHPVPLVERLEKAKGRYGGQ